jgi:hypothetical protein
MNEHKIPVTYVVEYDNENDVPEIGAGSTVVVDISVPARLRSVAWEDSHKVLDRTQEQLVDAEARAAKLEPVLNAFKQHDDGSATLTLQIATEVAHILFKSLAHMLSESFPMAINYLEQELFDPETGERFLVTVIQPKGRTPHQLREAAEAECDELGIELAGRDGEQAALATALGLSADATMPECADKARALRATVEDAGPNQGPREGA